MPQTHILIDSSFLYALYNRSDTNHTKAVTYSLRNGVMSLVPEVILTEVSFLFVRDIGHHAAAKFLRGFASTQTELGSITLADVGRAGEIMSMYATARFDFVDCCLMSLAERLNITRICTFDRRDFAVFKPLHCPYLELLP